RNHGAAVAAVPSPSSAFVEQPGLPRRRVKPREVGMLRRPFACRRAEFERVLEAIDSDEGLAIVLESVGVHTELVPAPSWNIKITTHDDWALAGAIAKSLRPG